MRIGRKRREAELAGMCKVACIGDSITYGYTILSRVAHCYPTQLGQLLGAGFHVENFGVTGSTAQSDSIDAYTRTSAFLKSVAYQPDIAVVMLGTNDSARHNWHGEEAFIRQYRALIQTYLDLDSKPRIFLCTTSSAYYIHGRTKGPYHYSVRKEQLRVINAAIYTIAAELDLPVIDIHSATAEHPEWYTLDGIHPNAEGAMAIARAVEGAIAPWTRLRARERRPVEGRLETGLA